ncbi:hypothetical protein PENTCL1PPCAC_5333 [Pristionchus entomophagus]|uniref:Aminoglycoside phosphotransferase domain-containing protein n=1 Tax=Pristionchus entomophagus TaxID=358040 RepID=A0AAV5SRC1_9BILA|nr:hypothetical protein PENTCL1PPCAC_5333 [Pristionchus entomophagus]
MEFAPKREDILALLREEGQQISNDTAFSCTRIGEGKGFISLIYKVTVAASSYVVKITNPRAFEGLPEEVNVIDKVHDREVNFYRWASKLSGNDKKELKLPQFFGGRHCNEDQEGIFIMEDFTDRMVNDMDWLRGLRVDLVKEILRSLASYQSIYLRGDSKFPSGNKKAINHAFGFFTKLQLDAMEDKPWISEAEKRRDINVFTKKKLNFQESIRFR